MSMQSAQSTELVNQLLCQLQTEVNNNNADTAQQLLAQLNNKLIAWCESEQPPTADELQALQTTINTILTTAENQKTESFNALLKHKKSGKAINAYKST